MLKKQYDIYHINGHERSMTLTTRFYLILMFPATLANG